MSIKVTINGHEFDYDAVINLMDDTIREELHDDFEAKTGDGARVEAENAQVFVDEYCARHEAAFGKPFVVN